MRANRDDRRMMGHQSRGRELRQDEALHIALATADGLALAPCDLGKRGIHHAANGARRARVAGVLVGAPYRFEALHEIGRRDDFNTAPAHELDRARIDACDIRHVVVG